MPQIIAKFVARITGRLREWWINLGEYRQRQAAQSNTLEDFFTIVHNEFLGSAAHYTEVAREEFLLMKCCLFERKDLEKHFDRMSRRYYSFNGMDDVNAKHTFLNSLSYVGQQNLPKVLTWSSPWPLKQKLSPQYIYIDLSVTHCL